MNRHSTVAAAPPAVSPLYQQLDALLTELVAHQTAMVQLAEQHRRAIAAADLKALAECNARQQTAAQNQMRLDSRRAALVTAISGRPAAPVIARNHPPQAPVTLRQLAS
ncbi:MAG: flagellar export chaperone FlgN, partial [Phycisphaerales bacterium]|nr:flagellar export chaperone FlgN [Phycisphaerales bacterium]